MKILIAEDDDISRLLLADILKSEPGYAVTAVEDGEAAWDLLVTEGGFDLAIFDVMMPGLSGIELLARVRGDRRLSRLPVIICTALNDRATVTSAVSLETTHYIVKPFSRRVVLEKVRSVAAQQISIDSLEAENVVCTRLGLAPEMWRTMLGKLSHNVEVWVSDLRQVLRSEQLNPLAIRANAMAGACINLGATGLGAQLGAAEVSLSKLEPGSYASHDTLIADPAVLSEITSIVESVDREQKRFAQAVVALTAPSGGPASE